MQYLTQSFWEERIIIHSANYLTNSLESSFLNKRVLITGAAGSVGSSLIRMLSRKPLESLSGIDSHEFGIFSLQQEFLAECKKPYNILPRLFIGDVRQRSSLRRALDIARPDIVIHAAALKHVVMLESNPHEGFVTNTLGTKILAEECIKAEVRLLLNISTDKAADPINVLGFTKRLGEVALNPLGNNDTLTASVRMGNILFSKGSLLPNLLWQAENYSRLLLTDKNASRYFISQSGASEFILHVCAELIAGHDDYHPGSIFVPNMGAPILIGNISSYFTSIYETMEKPLDVIITGLNAGEKLHEVLIGKDENVVSRDCHGTMKIKTPTLLYKTFEALVSNLEHCNNSHESILFRDRMGQIVSEINNYA